MSAGKETQAVTLSGGGPLDGLELDVRPSTDEVRRFVRVDLNGAFVFAGYVREEIKHTT